MSVDCFDKLIAIWLCAAPYVFSYDERH